MKTLLLCAALLWPSAHAAFYRVDARIGDDESNDADEIFRTIQKACDVVQPGDTVTVAPGVYSGPIVLKTAGTAEKPIIFKTDAVAKNGVIITNADLDVRAGKVPWTQEDAALQLYSIPFGHMPVRGLYDDVDLFPYPTLEGLRTFMVSGKVPGPKHGYAFDKTAGKLYVRLHPDDLYGPRDPAKHVMSFAPKPGRGDKGEHLDQPDMYAWGVITNGPAHVVFDGFTFESAGVAGLYIRGSDATVRNCWFYGCRFGVAGGGTSDNDPYKTDRVLIEQCYYTQFPTYTDLKEILREYSTPEKRATVGKFFWFARKGADGAVPDAFEYESGLVLGVGTGWEIRNNHFHECFDGISQIGFSWSRQTKIHHNRFEGIVDNAIETENRAADVEIYNNEIIDAFMPISWQPLAGAPWPGPIHIHHNLIYMTPESEALWNGVDYPAAAFKIGAHDKNWAAYNKQMKDVPKDSVTAPGDGFRVYNNTIVMPQSHFLERTNGDAKRKLLNFHFYDNVIATQPTMNKGVPVGAETGMEFERNKLGGGPEIDESNAVFLMGTGGERIKPSGLPTLIKGWQALSEVGPH